MTTLLRLLRRSLLCAAILVLLLVAAAGIAVLSVDRPAVREWLRPRIESLAGDALDATVAIDSVVSIGWQGVAVEGVSLARGDDRLLRADSARFGIGVLRAWPPLVALRIGIDGFDLAVRRDSQGRWNLVELFASEDDAPPPGWLQAVGVELDRGTVSLSGVGEAPIGLEEVSAALDVELRGAAPPLLSFHRLSVRRGTSTVAASGWVELGGGTRLEADVSAPEVAAADLAAIVPGWPGDLPVGGWIQVAGAIDDLRADAHLTSRDAVLDLWSSVAGIAAEPASGRFPAIRMAWTARGIDPARLAVDGPVGSLSGAGSLDTVLAADGAPSELTAEARLWHSGVGDLRADWLTAQARRAGERIELEVQAAAPDGLWSGRGRAGLDVAAPHAASAEIELASSDPAALFPEPERDSWRERLGASELRATVAASADRISTEGRRVEATLVLDGSRVRGVALEQAQARVRLSAELLDVAEVRLRGGATAIAGSGWVAIGDRENPSIGARLAGPVDLAMAGDASGVVQTSVALWGTTDALAGRIDARSDDGVRTPAGAGRLAASAEFSGIGGPRPAATAKLTGSLTPIADLEAVLGRQSQEVTAEAAWTREPARDAGAQAGAMDRVRASLAVKATDGREQRVVATAEQQGETTRVALEQLRLSPLAGEPWHLDGPARVVLSGPSIEVEDLDLVSGPARLLVDGRLERVGSRSQDFSIRLREVPLATVCELAGFVDGCGGDLGAALTIAGTAAHPALSASLDVADLALAGQPYGALAIQARADRDLEVEGRLTRPGSGELALRGEIPLDPGWPLPGIASRRPVAVTVSGAAIDLGGLRGLAGRDVLSELRGLARVDVDVRGTVAEPRVSGSVDVTGLAVGVAASGTALRGGRLAARFAGQDVEITEFVAEGGRLTAGGRVDLGGEGAGDLELWVNLRGLTVVDRPEATAQASGSLVLDGTMGAPRLTGAVWIDPATIRPNIGPGDSGPRDPTIVVVRTPEDAAALDARIPGAAGPAAGAATNGNGAEPVSFGDRLTMNVRVVLGSSVFVRRRDAEILLSGQVYATQKPGDPLRLTGSIESLRGWYLFQGRRLDLEHAYVSFSGETPIDPYLDVRAIYRSPQYRIVVAVQGTTTHPSLLLSSEPPLDQSDILSVLLFGKPASQLTGGQSQDLQKQAIGLLASYVAPELERSIVDTFGLASLTFQMPTGTTAGTIGIGGYLGQDLFVSIAQDFGGPQGGTPRQLQGLVGSSVTIQYYLTPSVTLQGAASSQGESSVDVIWHRRY